MLNITIYRPQAIFRSWAFESELGQGAQHGKVSALWHKQISWYTAWYKKREHSLFLVVASPLRIRKPDKICLCVAHSTAHVLIDKLSPGYLTTHSRLFISSPTWDYNISLMAITAKAYLEQQYERVSGPSFHRQHPETKSRASQLVQGICLPLVDNTCFERFCFSQWSSELCTQAWARQTCLLPDLEHRETGRLLRKCTCNEFK